MSDLETRIQEMEENIDLMMRQIEELYELQKISSNPFMAFLTDTKVKYRRKTSNDE